MPPVTVLVLSPQLAPGAGPLERALDAARDGLADRLLAGFLRAGAAEVILRREPPDDTPFGARLRRLVAELRPAGGIVVLGAGALPAATDTDLRAFVDAAAAERPGALANHCYSADAVAVACASTVLADLPDLPSDNALPRWLRETARVPVGDLRTRRHLAVDVDSPLDLVLLEGRSGHRSAGGTGDLEAPVPQIDPELAAPALARLADLRAVARDAGAELLVAGRTSAADLRWLETHTACRVRALIEERGLRTAAGAALAGRPNRRPARSVLGLLLDSNGPASLGGLVGGIADGAVIDSRVLLAPRYGANERAWPPAEDRFASDLLLPERIADPWLAALTRAAADAPIPVLLGGHSLVGPGLRIALGSTPR